MRAGSRRSPAVRPAVWPRAPRRRPGAPSARARPRAGLVSTRADSARRSSGRCAAGASTTSGRRRSAAARSGASQMSKVAPGDRAARAGPARAARCGRFRGHGRGRHLVRRSRGDDWKVGTAEAPVAATYQRAREACGGRTGGPEKSRRKSRRIPVDGARCTAAVHGCDDGCGRPERLHCAGRRPRVLGAMKRTYQPKKRKRARTHGFRARMRRAPAGSRSSAGAPRAASACRSDGRAAAPPARRSAGRERAATARPPVAQRGVRPRLPPGALRRRTATSSCTSSRARRTQGATGRPRARACRSRARSAARSSATA